MTPFDPQKINFFAKTDARGQNVPFGIKSIDRQKHMYVIGKTGMGKSTLLENMAVQDIRSGEGVAFIDPHGATAETLLDYIPEERKDDVLYFAPFDMDHPVSFNVMEDVGPDKRHLVVSGLMSVFEKIWVDAWSARMAYILQNTLMALLEYPDSTLLGVNRMLSDKNYRKRVVDNIADPSVKSFWVDEFAKYNERYMQEAGDAIKNKIGQFTANPLIRNIIGQPKSSFDLRKIMDEQKIVIMNLSKGLVGESNANLLGSMLTTRIYLAAMSRADLPQEKLRQMSNFYFYVDEFQSFANATFADILSEARKYKLNLTIAHQYIEQMEEEVKNAVFGNVGTIVSFRVGPFDAEILETIYAPQFQAIDIVNLGFAQIYLTLMIDGVGSQPFSAVTLPPLQKPTVSCRDMIIHSSRKNYARPRSEVEREILSWHEQLHVSETKNNNNTTSNSASNTTNSNHRPQQGRENQVRRDSPRSADAVRPNAEYRPASRPREEERPRSGSDNGRDRREPPREEQPRGEALKSRNLDELRAVLAGISKKDDAEPERQPERQSEKKPERRSERPDAIKKMPQLERQPERRPQKRAPAPEEPQAVNLKEALASAIKEQNTTVQPEPKPREVEHSIPPPLPPPNHEERPPVAPPPSQTQTQRESEQQSKDKEPLDPKAIERMLRVTTSDKTPFK